jgi:hypothetical protein
MEALERVKKEYRRSNKAGRILLFNLDSKSKE